MNIDDFASTPLAGKFPDAVQRYLGLASLAETVAAAEANGATRLLACPAFEPIEAVTLTFLDGQVHGSLVVSDDDVWERISCGDEAADDSRFVRRERRFSASDLRGAMQGWQPVVAAIAAAKSCMSDNPDGVSYYHLAFGAGLDSLCVWFNPTQAANLLERQIIAEYATIKALL